MLKRLSFALGALLFVASHALAAGSIQLAMSQQFDTAGRPLSGGKIYFMQAGTVATPQNVYSDTALTLALPNPVVLDSAGRVPNFYLADGSIKFRIVNSAGVVQFEADYVLVIGASGGGGGSSPSVDATTVLTTGDLKPRYGTGALSGFVRANGRTIGSSTSGATERANADTEALFTHLYNSDTNLTVSGGRGASAAADFAANKTITLPDFRGRALGFLDDMGNSAAGRLTTTTFTSLGPTVLGAAAGTETVTLTTAQIPSHTHTATTDSQGAHNHFMFDNSNLGTRQVGANPGDSPLLEMTLSNERSYQMWSRSGGTAGAGVTSSNGAHTHTVTVANAGGGLAHPIIPPTMLASIYIKL